MILLGKLTTNIVFHGDVEEMSNADVVKAYALVTRVKNGIDKRQKELRERMSAANPLKADDQVKILKESDLTVTIKNSSFGKRVTSEEKVLALLASKGIPKATVYKLIPAQPERHVFDPSKLDSMLDLGLLTLEEYSSVSEDVEPSVTVTVKVSNEIDEQISAILGGEGQIKRVGKKKTRKKLSL